MKRKKTTKPYLLEFLERAVRLIMEHRSEYRSEATALVAIAGKLGCSPDGLGVRVRQGQLDGGERPGQTSADKARSMPFLHHWFGHNGEVSRRKLLQIPHGRTGLHRNRRTRRDVEVAIFGYINGFYNPRRWHSALG